MTEPSGLQLIPEALALIVALAEHDGVRAINHLPGCWERALPDGWRFSLNGHDAKTKESSGACVPPYSAMVFHGDLLVGVIDSADGTMLADSENDFIAVLEAAMEAKL